MTSWKRLRRRWRFSRWVMPRSRPSESGWRPSEPAGTPPLSPSGWRSYGGPQPRIGTSYPPCWTARGPIARSTRFGMCWRRSMGAIASRSSFERRAKLALSRAKGREEPDLSAAKGRDGVEGASSGRLDPSQVPDVLERLTRIQPGEHRVVTCYLKLEPRDRTRGKYLIKLKNRVKSAGQALSRLGLDRPIADEITRDL